MPFYAQHIKAARLHLQKNDPVFKPLLKAVGPFTAKTHRDRFGTLVNSILSQQISVNAARTIKERLVTAIAPEKISPVTLRKFDVDSLRQLGVSRQKAGYVLDLAAKVHEGVVDLQSIHRKDDESVIDEMTQVKGIGRWTAQMFLMFSLGRLDILPVDDLGLKNAIRAQYQLEDLPNKQQMEQLAENWRPYATIACWYLWQSLEVE
jgi:DNA-3-methyladenine glycosylase II